VHELHSLGPAGGHCSRMQGFMQKLMMGGEGCGVPKVSNFDCIVGGADGPLPQSCSLVYAL